MTTQEENQLLLIDLCARLPYSVKCEIDDIDEPLELESIKFKGDYFIFGNGVYERYITEIKPYLRPMSSMTEEEKKDILQSLNIHGDIDNEGNLLLGVECNKITLKVCKKYLGELYKRMFDVCHMIEKGLAMKAKDGMYD